MALFSMPPPTRFLPLVCVLVCACLWQFAYARMPWEANEIGLSELPVEAQQTIVLIRHGGPFPYPRDGVVFGNREGFLPPHRRGYYREYTVPTPNAHNRGARRIVATPDGKFYYSDDHYQSFKQIRAP